MQFQNSFWREIGFTVRVKRTVFTAINNLLTALKLVIRCYGLLHLPRPLVTRVGLSVRAWWKCKDVEMFELVTLTSSFSKAYIVYYYLLYYVAIFWKCIVPKFNAKVVIWQVFGDVAVAFSICMRRTELPKRWNEGDSNWVAKSPLSSWQLTCIGQPDQVSHSMIFPSTFSLPLQDVPQPKPLALSKLGGWLPGRQGFWSRPASSIWRFRRYGDDEIRWYDEIRWNTTKYDEMKYDEIRWLSRPNNQTLDAWIWVPFGSFWISVSKT